LDEPGWRADPDIQPPFEVIEPPRLTAPLVFDSPHSGSRYPRAFLAASRLDHLERRLNVRVGPPARLVHRASIRFSPAANAAVVFIIIALAAYPPTPTRINSRRLHSIFTCRGRLF